MSIEAAYYENDDLWHEEIFLSDTPRFQAIADLIPAHDRTLLDVGCGNGAFVHFLTKTGREFDEIHATDRSSAALARVRVNKTQSSIDELPFADRSFDVVTCLEVIEHLPHAIYERGLANLCRIAKSHVIIGVPFNEDIEGDLIRCPSCTTRFNPNYHMRSYDEATIAHLLEPHGFRTAGRALLGGKARYAFVSAWIERKRAANWGANPFHTAIPCPMCGFSVPPGPGNVAPGAPVVPAPDSGIKGLVKKLLHRGTDYGAIATLYQRLP